MAAARRSSSCRSEARQGLDYAREAPGESDRKGWGAMASPLPRRPFLMALLAAALMPARAAPGPRKYRLGFLDIGDADSFFGGARKELLAALADLGYVAGRNLEVVECYEKESPEKLFECGRKLAALDVDVIVTEGTTS